MNCNVRKTTMTNDIIEKIIKLDKEFYTDFEYDDSWYYQRYSSKNEIFVLEVDYEIVGYFLFLGISKKLCEDIVSLKYDNDYYFPEKEIDLNSPIKYIPSVLVSRNYRDYSIYLIKELIDESLKHSQLVAITISLEGEKMCESCMNYIGEAKKGVKVFYINR